MLHEESDVMSFLEESEDDRQALIEEAIEIIENWQDKDIRNFADAVYQYLLKLEEVG